MKNFTAFGLGCLVAMSFLCLVSCKKEADNFTLTVPDGDPLEIGSRLKEVPVGQPKLIEEMEQDDVIVAINGYPLTRARYDAVIRRLAKNMLSRKGANQYNVADAINRQAPHLISQFVVRRLLIDQARKLGVMTDAELKAKMEEHIKELQKLSKKSARQIAQALGSEKGYYFYEIAERILLDEMISKHIPPLVSVDDAFVAKVQAQVESENEIANRTNELFKTQMREWKKKIERGELSFGEVAKEHSQGYEESNGIKGYWGEFEDVDFLGRDFTREVFNLPLGGISDPFEDDNCIRMVQVVGIKPPEKNAKGRVIQREIRQLAQVYKEKVPELIRQNDKEMASDLKRQMQLQAIEYYSSYLKTNGENQVVFPHGEKLFK